MEQLELDFSDHAAAVRAFDEAFCNPNKQYVINPIDAAVAEKWLRENAMMLNHGWPTGSDFETRLQQLGCMHLNQVIHIDTLYYRNRCGWKSEDSEGDNNGYLCGYPETEHAETCSVTGKRLCYTHQCPIACNADREDIENLYPSLWESDYKDYPNDEPDDWMVLYKRPRFAYVPNVKVAGIVRPQNYACKRTEDCR